MREHLAETGAPKAVVKSADRVLDLFELLAAKSRPLTHAELAAELGIPKSSLSQLIGNLLERGYVAFTPGRNAYTLGPSLLKLVSQHRQSASLPALAQPLTERITRLTDESSSLNLRRGDQVERACGANAMQALAFSMKVGQLAPMYAVSSGKILLAAMDEPDLQAYLARSPLVPITRRTLTSETALRRELKAVRRDRLAWSFEEYTAGIIGVAVPVLDGAGLTVGALNIAFPSARDSTAHRQRLVAALRDAALSLQRDIAAGEAGMAKG